MVEYMQNAIKNYDTRNLMNVCRVLQIFDHGCIAFQRACDELTRLCRISSLANSNEWEEMSMRFFNSSYKHMRAQPSQNYQ